MCRCASLALRAPVIPSRGCARGSATEDVVVLARRGEGNQARNALGQCVVSARVPACGRCALARRTARRCGPRSNPYRISPMRSRTQAVNQEGEPPTRKCPIRMQQKSHLRVRKRYADFAGCRGCNRQSLSLPSLKRMPPIWRDQTQIREKNHIDVIFLSAADIQLHISAGRGHPSARLKSAQSGFESQWGHNHSGCSKETESHLGQESNPPRRGGHLRGDRGLTPR